MGFVAINNEEMNIPQVTTWIMTTRDATEDKIISPEFAMEVLSKTNHFGHIKMILKNISNLPDDEKKKYKEFVVSCVNAREMSDEAFASLRKLACVCECEEEFDLTNENPKLFRKTDCGGITSDHDYINVIERREDQVSRVYLVGRTPDLWARYLGNIKEMVFEENAEIILWNATLPEEIDVSRCDTINLGSCIIGANRKMKFKEGAHVSFEEASDMPKYLDLSNCSWVDLSKCNLSRVEELKFREGSTVLFCDTIELPRELDVSPCSSVIFERCDFDDVKKITFKNKEQREKFMENVAEFYGEIVYLEEDVRANAMLVDSGMDM